MLQVRLDDLIHHTGKPPVRIDAGIDDVTHDTEPKPAVAGLGEATYLMFIQNRYFCTGITPCLSFMRCRTISFDPFPDRERFDTA